MKAILLAAGRGSRISRMIEEIPKSTLPIAGKPLIRMTVELLISEGIDVVVCVGYKDKLVKKALEGLNVKYYYNPFYDVTNSIASLWMAKNEINDDLIIANADVYFSKDILHKILKDKHEAVMAIDKSRTKVGDYFFSTTDNGCIIKYGKELPLEERSCEYVGFAKLDKSFLPIFNNRLESLISTQKHNYWWENILYSFTDKKEREIHTLDVGGLFWAEIDYFDDYERILNHIDKK